MEWRDYAACKQLPWEYRYFFFGEGDKSVLVHEQHERARMICYLCPVQLECLYYWYETDGEYGVWGGLTVSQRKRYLQPELRKKNSKRLDEVFVEVLWTLSQRILPKIQAICVSEELSMPRIPVLEPLPTPVLVQIISSSAA